MTFFVAGVILVRAVRESEIGSEYNYTTPMQLDIYLIEDEFRRIGVKSAADDPDALLRERISALLIHAERLAAEGLRFIPPTEEARRVFTQVRDRLHQLRGDLDTAIRCFQSHVQRLSGSHRATATIQLARLLLERGERHWNKDEQRRANKDFEEGAPPAFSGAPGPGSPSRKPSALVRLRPLSPPLEPAGLPRPTPPAP